MNTKNAENSQRERAVLDPWYRNPFGKSRPRDPEVAIAETKKRTDFFLEIRPALESNFMRAGLIVPEMTVIGSTAQTAATKESDVDIKAKAPKGTSISAYNQMVATGRKIEEEHNDSDQAYRIQFWFRSGFERE